VFGWLLRKPIKKNALGTGDAERLLSQAGQRWTVADRNAALKRNVNKDEYRAFWQRCWQANTAEYYISVETLRRAKAWCPAEREEERPNKYLKHQGRLTNEEHVMVLMYAKEPKLVREKKFKHHRQLAYNMYGKARVKWAWRKARFKSPERADGLPPPPHKTRNDLLPQARRDYTKLSQEWLEPIATNEDLLSLFRKRRGHTQPPGPLTGILGQD
jgi:hypothetical protein